MTWKNFLKNHVNKMFVEGNHITRKTSISKSNITEAKDVFNVIGKLWHF